MIAVRGSAEPTDVPAVVVRGVTMDITERKRADERFRLTIEASPTPIVLVDRAGQVVLANRNAEAAELVLHQDPPDLAELQAIVRDIKRDEQRAGEVVDRLRELLKRRDAERRPLSVSALLAEAVTLMRPYASGLGVRLATEVSPSSLQVIGDHLHLQQVILNLLVNGIQALGDQPPDRCVLTVQASLDGPQMARISVMDRGCGIPPDHLSKIFEPFFTTKEAGLGMGLPISRTIVEAHGGQIWAQNAPDGGAIFHCSLPVCTSGLPA